jgi:hypothetical protein
MHPAFCQLALGVQQIEAAVDGLEHHFEQPKFVQAGSGHFFRHENQNDLLLSYLKCVRATSTLHACLALLANGYVQEIGALCRSLDEFCEEVLFLATPVGDNGLSEQQTRLVTEFFQEEFDNIDNPFTSSQLRNRVPRSKVHAGIARIDGQPLNPNDAQELHRTLQQTFSGYVHGAYGHIMDLYGGESVDTLKYHMRGMLGTPRIEGMSRTLAEYVTRLMLAVEVVARRCGDDDSLRSIRSTREAFEATTGQEALDPKDALSRLKARRPYE